MALTTIPPEDPPQAANDPRILSKYVAKIQNIENEVILKLINLYIIIGILDNERKMHFQSDALDIFYQQVIFIL